MAGIDNNTLLYLRGDSFNDLSLEHKIITNNGIILRKDGEIEYFNLGTTEYMTVNCDFNMQQNSTIEFFLKTPTILSTRSYLISNGVSPWGKDASFIGFQNGVINFHYGNSTGAAEKLIEASQSMNTNTWYHIALVRHEDKYLLFLNGVKDAEVSSTYNFYLGKNLMYIGKNCWDGSASSNSSGNALIRNIRMSNVPRYISDFVPPTQTFNSIDINITNQTDDKIDFNISKLGQETINKIEVLVNDKVSKTYDSIGDLTYDIDKSLCVAGINKIKIKVTFDNDYSEEKEIDYKYVINNLPTSSNLKELIDRQEVLTNAIEVQKNTLKSILESKNIVLSEEENKLSILINKVNELGSSNMLYLYNNGIFKNYDYNILKIGNVYGDSVINNNCINLKVNTTSSSQWSYIGLSSTNAIDVSEYNKLNIKVKYNKFSPNGSSSIETLATLRNENSLDTDKVASVKVTSMNVNSEYIYSLDISNLNGSYVCQFVIGAYMVVSILDVDIYQVWLEK